MLRYPPHFWTLKWIVFSAFYIDFKLDRSCLWSQSLDWRINGEIVQKEKAFLIASTHNSLNMTKRNDGQKDGTSVFWSALKICLFWFRKNKISVNICATSQLIKKSLLQGLHIKETFFLCFHQTCLSQCICCHVKKVVFLERSTCGNYTLLLTW